MATSMSSTSGYNAPGTYNTASNVAQTVSSGYGTGTGYTEGSTLPVTSSGPGYGTAGTTGSNLTQSALGTTGVQQPLATTGTGQYGGVTQYSGDQYGTSTTRGPTTTTGSTGYGTTGTTRTGMAQGGRSGEGSGLHVPFMGGAEPRGVDTLGKKFGLAAFSFLLPPAAVAMKTGDTCETGLNGALCLLGYFPGLIHALIVSFSKNRLSCAPCGTILEAPGGPDTLVKYPGGPRRNSITTTDMLGRDMAATNMGTTGTTGTMANRASTQLAVA